MWSNRHESTEVFGHVLRTRKVHVSRLPVDYAGWIENDVNSSRFNRINTNRFPCCQFNIPEVDLRETRLLANRVESWSASCESSEVCCHVLRMRKVHIISLFHGSWLPVVRINAVRIESNRKVPQTNRLSLGVLDMDDQSLNDTPHGSILLQTT